MATKVKRNFGNKSPWAIQNVQNGIQQAALRRMKSRIGKTKAHQIRDQIDNKKNGRVAGQRGPWKSKQKFVNSLIPPANNGMKNRVGPGAVPRPILKPGTATPATPDSNTPTQMPQIKHRGARVGQALELRGRRVGQNPANHPNFKGMDGQTGGGFGKQAAINMIRKRMKQGQKASGTRVTS